MENTDPILIQQIHGSTLIIIINRERKLNALNKVVLLELNSSISNALSNREIKGIIITGAGKKAFIAGADISEFATYTFEQGRELAREGQRTVFDLIHNAPKPIIAAINGFALGGGLELAMACHIRIASSNAKMGLPEVSLGLIPGYGGTQRLTQLIGRGRAMEMILTGDMIDAQQALHFGLVNYIVSEEELLNTAKTFLTKMATRSSHALAAAIKAINASLDKEKDGFELEIQEFASRFGTTDFKEGVSAFLEKRPPLFER